jgi:glycosyltransferase involved in cell wall biosynthesis
VRLALVHDWLTGLRGGERVLDALLDRWPDADVFTLVHVPGATTPRIDRRVVATSFLDGVPGAGRHWRSLLPLHPVAARRLRISGYDAVVSVSHAVAKAARLDPGTPHLCYCLTPMRYVWDQTDAYLGRGPLRWAAAPLVAALRRFDRATSGPEQVTRFVAISQAVADRVHRHYGRRAAVVAPPVDTERFRPDARPPDDFYLLVSAFVPYKRDDLAVEAFARLGRRLVVVGDGPGRAALARKAPRRIEFVGRVSDPELARLFARCRALVQPQEEDFGLTAVEVQAAGRPVIAFGRGGAVDTVLPLTGAPEAAAGATGLWFDAQTPDALVRAVHRFEAAEGYFDAKRIRDHAERFATPRFHAAMEQMLADLLEAGPPGEPAP